jgi:hypothetical protein
MLGGKLGSRLYNLVMGMHPNLVKKNTLVRRMGRVQDVFGRLPVFKHDPETAAKTKERDAVRNGVLAKKRKLAKEDSGATTNEAPGDDYEKGTEGNEEGGEEYDSEETEDQDWASWERR